MSKTIAKRSKAKAGAKGLREVIAYCFANGRIEVGRKVPKGALEIAAGPEGRLRRSLAALARRGWTRGVLIVPGVPESTEWQKTADALVAFSALVKKDLQGKEAA